MWIKEKNKKASLKLNVQNTKILTSSPIAAAAKSLQSCPTLCDPRDSSPPGSPVPGILQARTLEWVAISFSNAWKWKVKNEVAQSCLTLSDPTDSSLPGSSIHGTFLTRVLEWGAIAFSANPITSHQIERGKMETMIDFLFLSSKITIDGDWSQKIKR